MNKRNIPVYQVSSEYADCLERAFAPGGLSSPVAASVGGENHRGQTLGVMGNTPLSSSQLGQISEDTVHLTVWADWGILGETLFNRLRNCQLESQGKAERYVPDDSHEGAELDFDPEKIEDYGEVATYESRPDNYIEGHGGGYIEFGGCLWKVLPNGVGGKDGRSYYPYVMVSGGVLLGVRRDKHETVSNLWVEMGSIPLAMNGGLRGVWKMLQDMLGKEGVRVLRDIVSRVDIYADFDHCGVDEFCRRFHANQKVTRARKVSEYGEELNTATYLVGRRYTGFSVGGNIRLRCYDKRYELQKDPIKWGVFADKYAGIPDILTRVEFQLRRVALKDFLVEGRERIEGVDSYLKYREQVWKWLTEDWFRLTEGDVDAKNKHQSRAKTWTVWEAIQNAVAVEFKEIFRHKRPVKVDMAHLFDMALGCICKLAVWEDVDVESAGDVLRHFARKVKARGFRAFFDVMEKHHSERHLQVNHFGGI